MRAFVLCPRLDQLAAIEGEDHLMLLAEAGTVHIVTQSGITLGSALAIVCSWERNKSILLAAIAGLLSWLYVLYFALTRRQGETRG